MVNKYRCFYYYFRSKHIYMHLYNSVDLIKFNLIIMFNFANGSATANSLSDACPVSHFS